MFLFYLAAFSLPLILIPVESVLPYPYIIEELTKALLVLLLPKQSRIFQAVLIGFLFSFSENMFYLTNIITYGYPAYFWQRFLLTTPLHITTTLIIFLLIRKGRWLLIPGLVLTMAIHFFYNYFILKILS